MEDGGGGREGATEGAREEQGMEGGRKGQGRKGNFKEGTLGRTLASIQHTGHKTTHNLALALETLVLQTKNGERVIIIIVLYYRLAEHIDRYMAVVQYIVITLHTQVQLLSSQ